MPRRATDAYRKQQRHDEQQPRGGEALDAQGVVARLGGERRPAFEALEGGRDRGRNRGLPSRSEEDGGPDRGRDGGGKSRGSLDARRIAGLARRLERQAAAQVQRNVETASQAPKATNSKDDGEDDALDGDPKALAIKLIVEAMTGKRIKIVSLEGVGKATANAEAAASEI